MVDNGNMSHVGTSITIERPPRRKLGVKLLSQWIFKTNVNLVPAPEIADYTAFATLTPLQPR